MEAEVAGVRTSSRAMAYVRGIARAAALLGLAAAAVAQPGATSPLRITGITPAGTNVPAGRQIVIQFNRPVVPIGRMDRRADEIPVEIAPPLACEWRWLDTSALACELGDGEEFALATRYTIVVGEGITAEDGATTSGTLRHEFRTEVPRVNFASFATWASPGTPVLRVVFTQPVGEASVREHLYLRHAGAARAEVDVEPDTELREQPRFIRPPGERFFLDLGENAPAAVDDRPTAVDGETARRVWLVRPRAELPLDTRVELVVEPGLESVAGPERGDENRVAVEFYTFPRFTFLGVRCRSLDGEEIVLRVGGARTGECNPLGSVGLDFSAPVLGSEVGSHVRFEPDLAGGRTDYDPWANRFDFSLLAQPHRRGRAYTVWLPERLKAAEPYRIRVTDPAAGPKDEFGRALPAAFDFEFATSHRPPSYTLAHPTAVLEQGVDSEVPLYVTNLERVDVAYRALTRAGTQTGLTRTLALPAIEDVQYGVPLGVREMLAGESGAIFGELAPTPALRDRLYREPLFAAVTPYQLHVKLGHFNSLAWVTDLATGEPVRGASISVYVDRISQLSAEVPPLARATTDANGIARLPGASELDPTLALLEWGCDARLPEDCPRLFVRADGPLGMALLPLDYRFGVDAFRASNYQVFEQTQAKYGHLHAWGTTAQGVYRAGDTMEWKLYVRDQDNESLVAAPPGPYLLEILDPLGQVVYSLPDAMLSKFGALSGEYAIPATAAVGWYQFRLTAGFAAEPAQAAGATGRTDPVVRYPMRVLVSDFTPASFGVRTTLNGDLFEGGQEVTAETRATLFSGGPYTDAAARVTAQLASRPFRSPHPVAVPFSFDTGTFVPAPVLLSQESTELDAQGEARHTFRIADDIGNRIVHGTLTVEGAVRDERGRFVAGTASAEFTAVDRLVGLRSTAWVFEQGKRATVQYLVVDARGAPAPGTDVAIKIERLETKAARVRGAGNAYLTQFVDEWLPAGECAGTSTDGPLECTFTPAAPGSYRLTASIADTRGRPHTTTLETWVVGPGQLVWRSGNDDALDIVPEQAEYEVGDTARYLVKNPYPGARALVTIERYGILKQWVETLEGSTPVIEFPVERDFLPGFYLSVLAMSPRVEAPPPEYGELDLGKPAFKLGYVEVPVRDPYKEIRVDVRSERAVYKPGETVRVRVQARPRARETREPIEVAVAVLDEAVLDLIQGGTSYFDPYSGFYTQDGLDVRNFSLLTRLVGRQKIDLKGANPGGDGGAAFSMRSVFKYVSYWNPSLELDARGNGSFEFAVPDNLTGWRVLVLAATPTDRLGLGQGSFRVNLPTEVRPVLPNQVTEGDRFDAAFSVMNRTDAARDIRVTIAAENGVAAPVSHTETVHLEPYARTTVRVPVEAARVAPARDAPAARIDFTVTARDATDGDGLRHSLAVAKRRSLETAASYGSFDGARATEALAFPDGIETDVGEVGVTLSPTVLGNLDGAFRYLRDYPYACWEQQLTRGVMAAHFVRLREYLAPDLEWPEAAALPEQALAQAAAFQAPNGGMAYFVPRDEYASPYLSAYTALAFAWLADDGYRIPEPVEAKLHEYLETFLRRDTAPDFYTRGMASTVRAVALAALAKRGRLALADLERYRPHVEYMSLFGKAHYLQAALAVPGGEAIAREIEQSILNQSVRSGGRISFNEVLDDGYLRISATPLNGSCAVLSAMTRGALAQGEVGIPGDVPFELVRTIAQARGNRDHWENTQENMFCVTSLLDYAQRYEAEAPDVRVAASIGGTPLGVAQFRNVRDGAVTLLRPIGPADPGTRTELTLERTGSGRVYYSARMSYAPAGDAARAVNAGIDVRREYSVQRDGQWVLVGNPIEIRRGELVRIDIFVSLPTARNFVVIDDPVPGGLEPVNRDLANASLVDAAAGEYRAAGGSWWFNFSDWREYGASRWSFYHQEIRHDAVRFYSEYLPPGNYHVSYTAQAIAAGEFAVLPTRAEEMYDPDVYGRGLPDTLRVTEEAP
jgi:uncharacterized protein YfaS (alpha-2-macroglobulin family)